MSADYDLCVIGGGVNGTGIARDAVGRGLSVILAEAQDLGGATSSASTKLIHGGLRYLEQYEFSLVRESLIEREILLQSAPHIIHPMDFVLPHDKSLRPALMIRLGLFIYDHLGGHKILKKSTSINFGNHVFGAPLQEKYKKGFSYTDCRVDDSRLVVLNALDAKERGASVLTRTAVTHLRPQREEGLWHVSMRTLETGEEFQVKVRGVVNAGGPWVRAILERSNLAEKSSNVRLIKGSHIIVPKFYEGEQAYILQQPDCRIVFAIPYEENFTLVGTTDVEFRGDPTNVEIDEAEKTYLCEAVNRSFQKQVSPSDIEWSYSGVRSLLEDGEGSASKVTRDYKLEMKKDFGPPVLSVFGGKITTYRRLSEQAVTMIGKELGNKKNPWTDKAVLPGGDFPEGFFESFVKAQAEKYPFLPPALLQRYARSYGTRMDKFVEGTTSLEELGRDFGDGVHEAEIIYLVVHEFAREVEDILWRRSKLGLHVSEETRRALEAALPDIKKKVARYG
ncbi:MAG: glycerol-3-phosphate dehydrogenase [Rhodospirillales bacterium]|nr:glycerol-3-phosphate dehydrogenase [Alphaproteobacteria bacterium]USO03695.1 MAG: glycerol-3-phosphate dehydrogenase [Rhodospirillales bacterium]